jgi:hypothetical protein
LAIAGSALHQLLILVDALLNVVLFPLHTVNSPAIGATTTEPVTVKVTVAAAIEGAWQSPVSVLANTQNVLFSVNGSI